MSRLSSDQAASRDKTLRTAVLLSMWAPITTGFAVLVSQSTTQIADFTRRTMELTALVASWIIFRYLQRNPDLCEASRARFERFANIGVAAALFGSSLVVFSLAVVRLDAFHPGGNVFVGMAIASLALLVNGWFWFRYRALNRETFDPIIDGQRRLYRAKSFVDLGVVLALGAVAVDLGERTTLYVDLLGSAAVAAYLAWSGLRTLRASAVGPPP